MWPEYVFLGQWYFSLEGTSELLVQALVRTKRGSTLVKGRGHLQRTATVNENQKSKLIASTFVVISNTSSPTKPLSSPPT